MYNTTHTKDQLSEVHKIVYENPKAAYSLASEFYDHVLEENLVKEQADALYAMSCACRVMSDYGNGLNHALDAYDIYMDIDHSEGIVNAQNMVGIIYFYFGDYSAALEYFMAARDAVTDEVPPRRHAATINNIGEVYREAGKYDKALEIYQEGLEISKQNDLAGVITLLHSNITEVYVAQGQYENAMEACMKAYKGVCEDEVTAAVVEYKLGYLMMHHGDYASAEAHYYTALIKLNQMNNKFYLIELLINMAELNELRGQNPLKYLHDALETAQSVNSHSKVSRVYKRLSDYYEQVGDMKSALSFYKHYHMKEKEIEADNLSHRLSLMLVEFNHSKNRNEHERFKNLSEKLKRDMTKANAELQRIREENTRLLAVSSIDELTQVFNRRGIEAKLNEVLSEEGVESALFIIDIDYFKKYNDTWGHLQGDICLRMVAQALQDLCQEDWFVGRFGGEEFILYAKIEDASMVDIDALGQSIRNSIRDLKLPMDKDDHERFLTVSVGGVTGKLQKTDISEWMENADRLLYKAKSRGRDYVNIKTYKV